MTPAWTSKVFQQTIEQYHTVCEDSNTISDHHATCQPGEAHPMFDKACRNLLSAAMVGLNFVCVFTSLQHNDWKHTLKWGILV